MNDLSAQALLHRIRDDIEVGPAPVVRVMQAGARQRKAHRAAWVAGGLTAACLAGAALVGVFHHPGDRGITETPNPANVAWWGDGVLHLDRAQVRMPEPDMMVEVRHGVVLWSETEPGIQPEPIEYVDEEGTSTVIGQKEWASNLASDPETGWVAWVEATRSTPPILVVYDTEADREVGRRELMERGPRWEVMDEGSYPIAIEDGEVSFAAQDGDYRWDVASGSEPERVTDADTLLMDEQAGVRLVRSYDPDRGLGDVTIQRPGGPDLPVRTDGRIELSPDGRYAVAVDGIGSATLIDTRTGASLETGLADTVVSAATFLPQGSVTYVAGTPMDPSQDIGPAFASSPPYRLVTCEIATSNCETVVDDIAGTSVVLPGW
jgi:hypothetical protein